VNQIYRLNLKSQFPQRSYAGDLLQHALRFVPTLLALSLPSFCNPQFPRHLPDAFPRHTQSPARLRERHRRVRQNGSHLRLTATVKRLATALHQSTPDHATL
jgi:hypothetical protein